MKHRLFRLLPLLAITLAACGPAARDSSPDQGQAGTAGEPRTLRLVARVEPDTMTGEGSITKTITPLRMFTAGLTAMDSRETPYPVLAERLPQLNTDTWKVFPDGRMETIYRIRSGLTWHDGRPLTVDDFIFALRVFNAETGWGRPPAGSGDARRSGQFMDEIVALDSQSLAIRWKRAYPGAGALPFPPLPQHLLETAIEQSTPDAYYNLDHWTSTYVGAGPFRMVRWEQGAFMEGTAFEGYALGRPKIDRIILTFSERPPVTVARLLSDDVDMALSDAIQFEQLGVLKEQWAPRTQGRFMLSPIQMRHVQIQLRPAYSDPPALLDVRARRALMHAIDRTALAEAMVDDRGMAADTMVPRLVAYYPAVDAAIAKYPYDIRRTEQLMAEAGFTRGSDGFFVSPNAGRFSPELWGVADGQDAQETTVVADFLKRAGIDARLWLYPVSNRVGDASDEFKATFPALNTNGDSLTSSALGIEKFTSPYVASQETRWRGTNKMGWSTPEGDRLMDGFLGTLDSKEADRLMVQMLTLLSNELPVVPLYATFSVDAHVGSLHGPEAGSPTSTRYYNLHEWEFR